MFPPGLKKHVALPGTMSPVRSGVSVHVPELSAQPGDETRSSTVPGDAGFGDTVKPSAARTGVGMVMEEIETASAENSKMTATKDLSLRTVKVGHASRLYAV